MKALPLDSKTLPSKAKTLPEKPPKRARFLTFLAKMDVFRRHANIEIERDVMTIGRH